MELHGIRNLKNVMLSLEQLSLKKVHIQLHSPASSEVSRQFYFLNFAMLVLCKDLWYNTILIFLLSILQIRIATQKKATLAYFLSNMVGKSTQVVILVMVVTGVPIQLQVMELITIGIGATSIIVLRQIKNDQWN